MNSGKKQNKETVCNIAEYAVVFGHWVKDEQTAFMVSHYDGFAPGIAGKPDSMLIPAFSLLIKLGRLPARRGRYQDTMT